MKNIYLRRNGWYWSKMVNGQRIWINLQTFDESEAVKKATEIKLNPLIISCNSIKSDVKLFINYKVQMNEYSRTSRHAKTHVLNNFASWLPEDSKIGSITQSQMNAYYRHLQTFIPEKRTAPMTESTAQGYMMTIRSFFRWAVEVKRARIDNPVKSVKLARCDRKARKEWCDKKLKNKLINNAPDDEMRFILFCGFDAGLRRGEIVEARKDWFDLERGILHVRRCDGPPRLQEGELPFRPKDRDERMIPLTKPFHNFLKEYLSELQPHEFALMADVKFKKWRYRYDFRKSFVAYMKSQKCERVTPHVMRHSFASILASASVSIFKISEWLGDDVRVVQRHYAKLAIGDTSIHALSG